MLTGGFCGPGLNEENMFLLFCVKPKARLGPRVGARTKGGPQRLGLSKICFTGAFPRVQVQSHVLQRRILTLTTNVPKRETKNKNRTRKRVGSPAPRRQRPGERKRCGPYRAGAGGLPVRPRPRPATSPSQSAPRASPRRCRVMTHFRRAPVPSGI